MAASLFIVPTHAVRIIAATVFAEAVKHPHALLVGQHQQFKNNCMDLWISFLSIVAHFPFSRSIVVRAAVSSAPAVRNACASSPSPPVAHNDAANSLSADKSCAECLREYSTRIAPTIAWSGIISLRYERSVSMPACTSVSFGKSCADERVLCISAHTAIINMPFVDRGLNLRVSARVSYPNCGANRS